MDEENTPTLGQEQKMPPERRRSGRQTWTSCCLVADRQMIVWLGQLSVMMSVLAFCAQQLIAAEGECNRSSPYIGLISFILGKALASVVDSSRE
jgi:hypothetical protein